MCDGGIVRDFGLERYVTAGEDICHPGTSLQPAVTPLCHPICITWQRRTRCSSGPPLFIAHLYTRAPRKMLLFGGGGIHPLYRTRAVYAVSMGSQSGNGRPNLGSVKAAITIHFISSTSLFLFSALFFHLLLSHRLLVHHLSSPFNSLLFSPLHLLSPFISSAPVIYSSFITFLPPLLLSSPSLFFSSPLF